jgi:hypothetical protein
MSIDKMFTDQPFLRVIGNWTFLVGCSSVPCSSVQCSFILQFEIPCYFVILEIKNSLMSDSEKSITLSSSWKNYFWAYLLGILFAPLLVGIVLLWFINKKRKKITFIITDNTISRSGKEEKKSLDLVHILSTSYSQTKLQKILGIGDIKLQANVSELVLEGIDHPSSLLEKIDTAIAYQKERLKANEKIKPRKATHDPGTLEKLDYLTGLWQQGLINDEDYDSERKKFE